MFNVRSRKVRAMIWKKSLLFVPALFILSRTEVATGPGPLSDMKRISKKRLALIKESPQQRRAQIVVLVTPVDWSLDRDHWALSLRPRWATTQWMKERSSGQWKWYNSMKYIEFKRILYNGKWKQSRGYAANEIRVACRVASDNIDAHAQPPVSLYGPSMPKCREIDDESNVFMRPVAFPASLAVRTYSRLSSSRRGSCLRP